LIDPKGAVPVRTRGFGHTAPTYVVGTRDQPLHRLSWIATDRTFGSVRYPWLPLSRHHDFCARREEETADGGAGAARRARSALAHRGLSRRRRLRRPAGGVARHGGV